MKKLFMLMLAALMLTGGAMAEAALPAFEYRGPEPYVGAICEWLLENVAEDYAGADVCISCPVLLEVDDADDQDILVWGDFCLYHYALRNTTLVAESGGNLPGHMRLRAVGGGYAVTALDRVADGDEYAESLRALCGGREGLMEKFADLEEARDIAELQYVSDYVNWNGLNITQLQHFGWAPVALVNAPETPEADQMVRFESRLGYALDYDLRAFSYDRFDDHMETFSGVAALEGCSLTVRLIGEQSAEDALAELCEDIEAPVRETVSLGADAVNATRLWDDALADGVDRCIYAVPLNEENCLLIYVNNTYYAMEPAMVVPGADEALDALLGTFRLEE